MKSLYVCLFSNGIVKVGRGINPQERIRSHRSTGEAMGVDMVNHCIAECPGDIYSAERELISWCVEQCTKRMRSEWFMGIDYAQAVEKAKEFASNSSIAECTNKKISPTEQAHYGIDRLFWHFDKGHSTPIVQDVSVAKVFSDSFVAAKSFGLSDREAAIRANNSTQTIFCVDVLGLMGIDTSSNIDHPLVDFTRDMSDHFLNGLSNRKMNRLLAEAGLQCKEGSDWVPMKRALGLHRWLDTGCKRCDGTPILQLQWLDGVVDMLEPYPEN